MPKVRHRQRSAPALDESLRNEMLSARRNRKMARSAHAYVRGSTARFYEWISEHSLRVPDAPTTWICGDCHVGNLGPISDARGAVEIQIRDFDQTVFGNPAHDLLRLCLSLASAARGMDLAGVTTLQMIEEASRAYCAALLQPDEEQPAPPVLAPVTRRAARRAWTELAHERLDGLVPALPRGKDFIELLPAERAAVHALFERPGFIQQIDGLLSMRNERDSPVRVVDAAWWVKGCSSLGLMRVAALVAVGRAAELFDREPRLDGRFWRKLGRSWKNGGMRLLDFKQATAALAPASESAPHLAPAERVTMGASHMSPHLGDRMAVCRIGQRSMFVRELLPQDLKLEFSSMSARQARRAAAGLAGIVGIAHGRQMHWKERAAWARSFNATSKTLQAPSWLWNGVCELMSIHEGAYLDHCRRYGEGQRS